MKKVFNITINSQVFAIEEDAYQKLNAYLEQIRIHFRHHEEGEEVVQDIESGIAEKFLQRSRGPSAPIRPDDVGSVIAQMGTVEDLVRFDRLGDEETETEEQPKREAPRQKRRLFRDADDRVLGGVAAGIAHFFGIDPVFIRILFALSVLVGGTGVFVYLVLWIIIPKADSTAQKMQMRGSAVTLSEFEQVVKEKVSQAKQGVSERRGVVRRILVFPFRVLRAIFRVLGRGVKALLPILRVALGAFLLFISVVALFAVTTTGIALIAGSGAVDPATRGIVDLFAGSVFGVLAILGAYLVVLIPLLLLFLAAVAIVRKRRVMHGAVGMTLFFVWFLAAAVAAGTGVVYQDEIEDIVNTARQEADGTLQERVYTDLSFDRITISGAHTVQIVNGPQRSVRVRAPGQTLEELRVEAERGVLRIKRDRSFFICIFSCRFTGADIVITTPGVREIELSGASRGSMDAFSVDSFSADFSGSSRFILNVHAGTMHLEGSGSSRIKLLGSAQRLTTDLSGSSRISGFGMRVEEADVHSSGAGRIDLTITRLLNVDLSGSHTVRYIPLGDVDVLRNISGRGSVSTVSPFEAEDLDVFDGLVK